MRSIEWIINRMCVEKKSFNKEEAEEIIDKKAQLNQVFYWYKCRFCQRYHLSRQAMAEHKVEIVGGKNET